MSVLLPDRDSDTFSFADMCRLAGKGCEWATRTLDRYETSLLPVVTVYHPRLGAYVAVVVWDYEPCEGGDAIES